MELVTWLTYNCLLALLPVLLVGMVLWLSSASVSLAQLVRDGQLFFYAASLSAAAIGDLVKRHTQAPNAQDNFQLWIAAMILCVILATFFFGVAAAAKGVNDKRLAWMSYGFTVGCTALVGSMRYALTLF